MPAPGFFGILPETIFATRICRFITRFGGNSVVKVTTKIRLMKMMVSAISCLSAVPLTLILTLLNIHQNEMVRLSHARGTPRLKSDNLNCWFYHSYFKRRNKNSPNMSFPCSSETKIKQRN